MTTTLTELPQRQTKVSLRQALEALKAAYVAAMGRMPKAETLAILCTQSALETGHWVSMWNWNFGNMRGDFQGLTQSIKNANEIIDGKKVVVEAGFRAYSTMEDGALDFVRQLLLDTTPHNDKPNRYQYAADAAERGDLVAYNAGLKRGGYYTDSEKHYLGVLRNIHGPILAAARDLCGDSPTPATIAQTMRSTAQSLRREAVGLERAADALERGVT